MLLIEVSKERNRVVSGEVLYRPEILHSQQCFGSVDLLLVGFIVILNLHFAHVKVSNLPLTTFGVNALPEVDINKLQFLFGILIEMPDFISLSIG